MWSKVLSFTEELPLQRPGRRQGGIGHWQQLQLHLQPKPHTTEAPLNYKSDQNQFKGFIYNKCLSVASLQLFQVKCFYSFWVFRYRQGNNSYCNGKDQLSRAGNSFDKHFTLLLLWIELLISLTLKGPLDGTWSVLPSPPSCGKSDWSQVHPRHTPPSIQWESAQ